MCKPESSQRARRILEHGGRIVEQGFGFSCASQILDNACHEVVSDDCDYVYCRVELEHLPYLLSTEDEVEYTHNGVVPPIQASAMPRYS
jgi:hypothetical protein